MTWRQSLKCELKQGNACASNLFQIGLEKVCSTLHLAALCFEWRIRLELLTVEIRCLLKWRAFWTKKNINKLKLCLQTDLCLKGCEPLIWQISGDSVNGSKPPLLIQLFWIQGRVHPVVHDTGCCFWRWKVINKCEENVWNSIFDSPAKCSELCKLYNYVWYFGDQRCKVYLWYNWTLVRIKKNNLSAVKLEACINHG